MKQQTTAQTLCLCLFLLMLGGSVSTVKGADLAAKCGQVVQKVIPCLTFATGKAAVPTKDCCDATANIKDSAPDCLCYIIQQTHKGSSETKSVGIQEAKLLQLPSACNLKNASVTNCPKLLGLPANSPDAAIFTNASSTTSPATIANSTTPSQNESYGSMLKPHVVADILAVCWAFLLLAFPSGSGSLSLYI